MVNWEVGKWYYVVLQHRSQHLFKHISDTEFHVKLDETHWDLCGITPNHRKDNSACSFDKKDLTFTKKLTDKEALHLQSGIKFESLPKQNIYELW